MSFQGQLVHDVTIYTPDFAFSDRYGDPITSDAISTTEKALIQPRPGSEDVIDRDTRTERFLMFFRSGSAITGLSTIVWGTHRISVDGEPRLHAYGSVPHIEADGVEYKG